MWFNKDHVLLKKNHVALSVTGFRSKPQNFISKLNKSYRKTI